ncbi:MAG: hypothetical protein U0Z75_07240 [Deinococcaceae bacterium]
MEREVEKRGRRRGKVLDLIEERVEKEEGVGGQRERHGRGKKGRNREERAEEKEGKGRGESAERREKEKKERSWESSERESQKGEGERRAY